MDAVIQELESDAPATAAPLVDDGAEPRNNAVLSAPSTRLPNTALVRCSTCGVVQHLLPTQGADVGGWMPCSLCWRSLTREARLAYLPRFRTLSGDDQRPWRHRFTLIGVAEAELRREVAQEPKVGAACSAPVLGEHTPTTVSEGQAQRVVANEPEPPRCKSCGCILHQGLHAA